MRALTPSILANGLSSDMSISPHGGIEAEKRRHKKKTKPDTAILRADERVAFHGRMVHPRQAIDMVQMGRELGEELSEVWECE